MPSHSIRRRLLDGPFQDIRAAGGLNPLPWVRLPAGTGPAVYVCVCVCGWDKRSFSCPHLSASIRDQEVFGMEKLSSLHTAQSQTRKKETQGASPFATSNQNMRGETRRQKKRNACGKASQIAPVRPSPLTHQTPETIGRGRLDVSVICTSQPRLWVKCCWGCGVHQGWKTSPETAGGFSQLCDTRAQAGLGRRRPEHQPHLPES
ncbi:hypothetical protein B0T16DRAFT_186652 [Cercophora newfieldiana]|uniref:Uncharacterized protein n=1 Tax=Cercophora newfieldiana TaxID=92897 RepID=A0AA40CM63_9PEZI|nr:hypothetical protein B0T16DRAFT_186652 [Cercophora newfieldiana]